MGKLKNEQVVSSVHFANKRPNTITRNNPVVLSLLVITIFAMFAYLPLVPFLGFYSEDFFFGYIGHFYGSAGLIKSLAVDRPFNGYLLALNYLILKDNVLLWHIYGFLLRLLGGYALFFLLFKLWPKRLSAVTFITLLFLIYPGFLQQTLPLGYQVYPIGLILWISSLIFSLLGITSGNRFKLFLSTLTALILQITSFLNLEFFIGMEVLRLLLIMYVLKIRKINFFKIKKTFIYWSPYIFSTLAFVLWRILIFNSTREVTDINWIMNTFYSNPIWLAKIPLEILYSATSTIILPYILPILLRIPRIPLDGSVISFSVGIFCAILLYFYYKIMPEPGYSKHDVDLNNSVKIKNFGKGLLVIGLISILGSLIPIILFGRFVRLFNVFDRYTITGIIAVSFIIVGFLFFKTPSRLRNQIIILLVALSVTTHLMNGYLFATNWDKQKDIWWQLFWRAPKIQNNAMLIFDFPPLTQKNLFNEIKNKVQWYRIYWVDYQIWMAGNLFFNYDNSPQTHFNGDFLPDDNIVQKIKNKIIESRKDRNIIYTRDFNNIVIITTPNDSSCLWVFDGHRQELPENSTELLKSNIVYSDIDKLVQKGSIALPPTTIFGREPSKTWCYYFQKASLARQFEDWNTLSRLTQEVLIRELKPTDINEWLPFIEGLIVSKKYSQAENLIKIASKNNSDTFSTNLCKMGDRLRIVKLEIYCQL